MHCVLLCPGILNIFYRVLLFSVMSQCGVGGIDQVAEITWMFDLLVNVVSMLHNICLGGTLIFTHITGIFYPLMHNLDV